jgi:hypothetical protein
MQILNLFIISRQSKSSCQSSAGSKYFICYATNVQTFILRKKKTTKKQNNEQNFLVVFYSIKIFLMR